MMVSTGLSTIRLLGDCLAEGETNRPATANLKKKLSSKFFDWKDFCHIAGKNWLLPYLYDVFERKALLSVVPQQVQMELLAVKQLAAIRNRRMREQLQQIIDGLNQHDIQPLLLKGASYLMEPVSQIQYLRMTSDIDLLVHEASVVTSVEVLKRQGYSFSKFLPGGTDYHLNPMTRDGMPARIELHTKPLSATCERVIPSRSVWGNANLIQNNRMRYYIFKPGYRLIHQFAHAQLHSRDHANERIDLRQLFDFYLMYRIYSSTINWPCLESNFSEIHKKIWCDYLVMAKLVFSDLQISAVPRIAERRARMQKILAKSNGDTYTAYLFHWMERLMRLPQRVASPDWYLSKLRYLFYKL